MNKVKTKQREKVNKGPTIKDLTQVIEMATLRMSSSEEKIPLWTWFQKQRSIDYKEIEEKEAGGESKMEKITKFLMEDPKKQGKGGQKKLSLEDLIAKKKQKKKEMQDKTDGNWFRWHAHQSLALLKARGGRGLSEVHLFYLRQCDRDCNAGCKETTFHCTTPNLTLLSPSRELGTDAHLCSRQELDTTCVCPSFALVFFHLYIYRARKNGLQNVISTTQAGSGRLV